MATPKGNKHHKGMLDPIKAIRSTPKSNGPGVEMKSKYKGHCNVCHYTIWQNEKMRFDGAAKHINCLEALKDGTPRSLDVRYISVYGRGKKAKLNKLIDKRLSER